MNSSLTPEQIQTLVSWADAKAAGAPTINYGVFLNTILDFVIIAFAVFLLIKQVNRLQRPPEPAPVPATRDCPFCCTAISEKAVRCGHCTSQVPA